MNTAAPLQNLAAKPQSPGSPARTGLLVQRKCACGTPKSSLTGECAECKSKKFLQAKLTIGASNDPLEQEADRVADSVMRMPRVTGQASAHSARPTIQRKIEPQVGEAEMEIPSIAHEVLQSSGRPLDTAIRTFLEPRFGHDFGRVRVHTDAKAAKSAAMLGARAYTVGQNVVFGAGEYRPGSDSGRHLLSHELTHTIQQHGSAVRLQRSCVSSPCPAALVPVDALFPRYEAAEKCIQTLYASTHPAKPGISLSYNADWLHLTGASPNQKLALGCLRGEETPGAGPNFTAKGLMYPAAPDMWDFLNRTMYEITTPSGAAFRVNKLGAQIALANQLCGPADCGGMQFDRGTWSPPAGCFSLGGDLYFTASNTQGVIVYNMFKDATKELATALVLAALAAALKNFGPKAGAAAVTKIGGKLIPAYAVASLVAVAVLLASGRAEAKLGPGDEEPLVSLFKELEKKGTKVPPEIQEMLDANPELKEKLNKALSKGGDPTAAQEEINKQILDTIAANKDKFTAEELEALLTSTQVAGKALPKGDMTADELKKLAAAVKAGKTGGQGKGGGSAPPLPQAEDAGTDKPKDTVAKSVPSDEDATSPLSQSTRDNLAKAPVPVRDLLKGLLGDGPNAKKLSDAQIQRFLSMMPRSLSATQVLKLLGKRKPAEGETADQILDSLQAILADLDKPAAPKPDAGIPTAPGGKPGDKPDSGVTTAPTSAPAPNATLTTGPTVSGSKKTAPDELIKELAAKAKKTSFTDLQPATYRVTWKPEEVGKPTIGSFISGGLRGKLKDGTGYVGRVEAEVTAASGSDLKLKIKFVTATVMVSADGTVVLQPDRYIGREDSVVLDPPKKGGSK